MAVAVPKRRSTPQGAPAPSRTAPPEPKKRPRDRPRPGGQARSATAAPAAPPKRKPASPIRKTGPGRKKATSARASTAAPARRKVAPKRRSAGVIPIAAGHAGRAAVAVTQLPESGLIHRLTRGRVWIAVLGVLLVGIVALNVVTLSFAASSGKIDARNTELGKENSMLQSRVAQKYGQVRLRSEAGKLGLAMPTQAVPQLINAHPGDVGEAAARLAAGTAGTSSSEAASGEEAATGEKAASGEETASGEEAAASTTGESEYTPEEQAIYEREYAELLAAEGLTE
jgi:hypothetical protein